MLCHSLKASLLRQEIVTTNNNKKEKTSNQVYNYNQFQNILRLFDVLPNFPFTASETMGEYCLQTWYLRGARRVAERLKT